MTDYLHKALAPSLVVLCMFGPRAVAQAAATAPDPTWLTLDRIFGSSEFSDPKKHPEFAGTVASVETRGSSRPVKESASNFDYHWNHNGESHYLVGEAMGQAMVKLLKSNFTGKG